MKKNIFRTLLLFLCGGFITALYAQSAGQNLNDTEWPVLQQKLTSLQPSWTSVPEGIISKKFTTGMLLGNGDVGVVAGDRTDQQTFYFGKSDFWGAAVKNPEDQNTTWQESVLSVGRLTIRSAEPVQDTKQVFEMQQDFVHAEVHTALQLGDAVVHMNSWMADEVDADENNIFITELSTDKDVKINTTLWVPHTYKIKGEDADCMSIYPYASGVSNGTLWAGRANYNYNLSDHSGNYKAKVAMALSLKGATFSAMKKGRSSTSGIFKLKAGVKVIIAVAFSSAKSTASAALPGFEDLKNQSEAELNALKVATIEQLKNAHYAWWKNYWLKSWVTLSDPAFEKFYYGSLYVLGSAIRSGNFPPSLFGNWITTDLSSWGGRYFLNYNEEAAYYGAGSSNRPELILPYSELIFREMPWQRNKTHAAGYEGVCHQRSLTPYHLVSELPYEQPVASHKDYKKLPADQKSNGVFAAMPLIWYYEYTGDIEYLRDKLYPYLKELDAFYRSYLDTSRRPYRIEHSSAHEGSDDVNPNLDIGFIRRICRTLITTSQILRRDQKMVPVWQDVLDNLSDYPTIIRQGKTVYVEAQLKNGMAKNLFHVGDQPVNLEGGVFPGENIFIGSDSAEIGIALESVKQLDGWSIKKGGSEHNGFPKIWPVAARIGWPAADLYDRFKASILYHLRETNLTAFQGGGGIETAGAIEGINSMLMQSEGGIIRLFPVWPVNKDAAFFRLRAKAAFLVSSSIKNGEVEFVTILSEKGGPCSIKNPWPGGKVRLKRGRQIVEINGPLLIIKTKAQEQLELEKAL
ncbi:MAG TPA: hypothetical protein VL053_18685 [Arachidicoccus sp.]|nr:hypothetical protein [Arachidicoccus sp.]